MNSTIFKNEWKKAVGRPDLDEQLIAELIYRFDGCVEEADGGGVYGTVTFDDGTAVSVTSDYLAIVDLTDGFQVIETIEV